MIDALRTPARRSRLSWPITVEQWTRLNESLDAAYEHLNDLYATFPLIVPTGPAETTIIFPFSDGGTTGAGIQPFFDLFPISAGHGDLIVMEMSVVFTTLTCVGVGGSTGFDNVFEIQTFDAGGVFIDTTDGPPLFNSTGPRNPAGDWSTDFRGSSYNAPYGGLPLTPGFGVQISSSNATPFGEQSWAIAGTITIIVQGYDGGGGGGGVAATTVIDYLSAQRKPYRKGRLAWPPTAAEWSDLNEQMDDVYQQLTRVYELLPIVAGVEAPPA